MNNLGGKSSGVTAKGITWSIEDQGDDGYCVIYGGNTAWDDDLYGAFKTLGVKVKELVDGILIERGLSATSILMLDGECYGDTVTSEHYVNYSDEHTLVDKGGFTHQVPVEWWITIQGKLMSRPMFEYTRAIIDAAELEPLAKELRDRGFTVTVSGPSLIVGIE